MLHISGGRFKLRMQLNEGEKLPKLDTGIFTQKDYWKLTGVIEYDLEFKCDAVSPAGSGGLLGTWRMFALHPIYLIPSGWDAMSARELSDHFAQLQKEETPAGENNRQGHIPVENRAQDDLSVCFKAILFQYPFFGPFCGRDLKGEIEGFDFTLNKENEDADLVVSLTSKGDYVSQGEKEEWTKFYAFMAALAFTNGAHAWPYRIEHWRGGRKITDLVTAANQRKRILHTPFTDNLAFHAGLVSKNWNYQEILKRATTFFEANSTLSKEISHILFLLREADGKEVHSDITMIALCALFENLVQLLFRELKLEEKSKSKEGEFKDQALQSFVNAKIRLKADLSQQIWKCARLLFKKENLNEQEPQEGDGAKLFKRAKNELQNTIDRRISDQCQGVSRMYGLVSSASTFSTPKQFEAILDDLRFGQQWRGELERAFAIWKRVRNNLFHDKARTTQSQDDLEQDIRDQCRIGAAINVILLKLMGYSGLMRASTLEGIYQ